MTVQTTTSRADYTGNGVTTTFTVPFYFLDNTHLIVYRTQISTATVTTLALTTDYTVSGAGVGTGGSITCLVAPTADQKVAILRNIPLTQLTNYVENDPFPAESHEQALDKLTMEVQQVNEVASRSLVLPAATTGISTALPTPIANRVLGWDAMGTALANIDASLLSQNIVYGETRTQTASGNGVTTVFTLSSSAAVVNNLQVYISGVRQAPTVDYTLSNTGVTVTFLAAPPSGTNNILFVWQYALPAGTAPTSGVQMSALAATGTPSSRTYLRGDGVWATPAPGVPTAISTNTLATAGTNYLFTASLTLTLPATPTAGDWVMFSNFSNTSTCVIGRNSSNIMALAENLTVDGTTYFSTLVYADATRGWIFA